ncbi:MAG: prepilin peptidase [Bacilli bacterium]
MMLGLMFVYGLIFGSFFNVVGWRVPQGMSIVKPGSHCPHCERTLGVMDLIPILSWVSLGGKCRSCKSPVHVMYPLFELITGVVFSFAYWTWGWSGETILFITFYSMLIVVSISDLHFMLVSEVVLLFFGSLLLIEMLVFGMFDWKEQLLGFLVGYGTLLAISLAAKAYYKQTAMGYGDVELYGVIGFVVGWKLTLLSLFFACLFGIVHGLLLQRRTTNAEGEAEKLQLPFVPSIALGTFVAVQWGEELLQWYFSLL